MRTTCFTYHFPFIGGGGQGNKFIGFEGSQAVAASLSGSGEACVQQEFKMLINIRTFL
jgi:hypothetical protein